MMHDDQRFVASAPARRGETPDRVDVFAAAQRLVETADFVEGLLAHDEGGGGDIADACAGDDAGRLRPEVERRVTLLVAGDATVAGVGGGSAGDAWGDESDPWVVEVPEQTVEPSAVQLDVGVDERDDRRLGRTQPGVTRRRRPGVVAQSHERRPAYAGERRPRAVVDEHDGGRLDSSG